MDILLKNCLEYSRTCASCSDNKSSSSQGSSTSAQTQAVTICFNYKYDILAVECCISGTHLSIEYFLRFHPEIIQVQTWDELWCSSWQAVVFRLATLLIVLFREVVNTDLIADARDIWQFFENIFWDLFETSQSSCHDALGDIWQVGPLLCVHHHFEPSPFEGNDSHCGSIESKNLWNGFVTLSKLNISQKLIFTAFFFLLKE